MWFWCDMHIQLLSFKIRCLSKRFLAISVLNLNLMQQVEMRLCHVYFLHCHTTWSTAHVYYVILSKKILPLKDLTTFAYTTGTTSKHQRFTWPALCRKLIVFLRIVVWHISVHSLTRGYVIRMWIRSGDVLKNVFLLRMLKLPRIRMWQPTNE